ncbi:MAG: TolC family protein [Candidatus Magnetomorum sp.]|nr:TolC family protein [Candidatus Magnetomorum sp.]
MKTLFKQSLVIFFILMLSACVTIRYSKTKIVQSPPDVIHVSQPTPNISPDTEKWDINSPLSITTALQLALKNNPDTRMALARIEQARADIRSARSAFFPTIDFYTEFVSGETPSGYLFKTIDQRKLPPNTNFNNPGWFENYETGVNVNYTIFSGGRHFLSQKMAQKSEHASHLDKTAIENQLMASVVNAYYDALAAEDYIHIARESVASVEEQLRMMQVRFEAGGALQSDVLSLQVRLAQVKEAVVRSTNQQKISIAVLSNLIALTPDHTIILKKTETQWIDVPENDSDGFQFSIENRPEIHKVHTQISQSRLGVDAAMTGYLPQVNLFTRHYYDAWDMGYHSKRRNWSAGAMLNWNLFNGMQTQAQVDKASARLQELTEAYRKIIMDIRLDVKNAYLNLDAANARLIVAKSSVESAQESFQQVKKQYEGGSANITRYLEAELDRNRARISATAAYYDREKGYSNIARAIGLWSKWEPSHKRTTE